MPWRLIWMGMASSLCMAAAPPTPRIGSFVTKGCVFILYDMINYVTYGFCGVRYFKKDRHERNNISSSIFAGIALILNLAFLHTIEVCKSHETHGGASSCPSVPYLSCSWQRHWSEGVCWWQQQRVSWLVLAAVWWRGGCGGATPGTSVSFKIPSTVRTVLWVWLSSFAAFVRSFRLASCPGTRATATLVLETFPCPNPITTPWPHTLRAWSLGSCGVISEALVSSI